MSRLGSAWKAVVQRLPCVKRNDEDHPKTVNISVGFFFLLNYGVGTGFLGMPFAFYHAGILVSAITLLVSGFATWAAAIWVLEVMARAQVSITYYYIYIHILLLCVVLNIDHMHYALVSNPTPRR